MPLSYHDLVAQAKREIREVSVDDLASRTADPPLIVDVREPQEFATGTIAGAVLIPRGVLAGTIVRVAPDPATEIVLLCSHGNRSALAAKELQDLGYRAVASLAGGFTAWRASGREGVLPGDEAAARYARHLVLPGVGAAGQRRLGAARVLVVGAGGLGSPVALYLAAAGVGTIGIVDDDVVDLSNLQRQVLHTTAAVGTPKVASAARTLAALNPEVEVVTHPQHLEAATVIATLMGYDLVVDGSDNFPTRYLINDAALRLRIPVVHGSLFRWEGQCTVIDPYRGPCYRCLFPLPPPPDLAPDCAEAGVFGAVAGVVGSIMAVEVAKLILGIGEPLIGRLMVFDGLSGRVDDLLVRRDPACPACGDEDRPPILVDYDASCRAR
ncbi:MAG: molybdopterin-synthase adenylyltransferase MoeB [Acidimicrobiia bacterium]|nr:molybdopterin-synthase adenylyltransferase MoeB [Acidimicrobiia bacterium]